MAQNLYRYTFIEDVPTDEVESALLLALWGCESLHGESQTKLDASHYLDVDKCVCVIDASTQVGQTLNRLFIGFIRREFGEESFRVKRVGETPTPVAA